MVIDVSLYAVKFDQIRNIEADDTYNKLLFMYSCTANIDECANVTCQNGGTCQDGVNTFTCNCVAGYTGQYCQSKILGNNIESVIVNILESKYF